MTQDMWKSPSGVHMEYVGAGNTHRGLLDLDLFDPLDLDPRDLC